MNKYVIRGVKKLFSLTKTKIRLSREADTVNVKPAPLPLVKIVCGEEIHSVDEAEQLTDALRENIDFEDPDIVADTVLCLMDVIEGVKYLFEPPRLCALVKRKELKIGSGERVNILLMDEELRDGVNIYVGYEPPRDTIHYGRVPTTLSHYLAYALSPNGPGLKNTNVWLGKQTLISDAIYYGILQYCKEN